MKKILLILAIVLGFSLLASAQDSSSKKKRSKKSTKEVVTSNNGEQHLSKKIKQEQLLANPILLKPRLVKD